MIKPGASFPQSQSTFMLFISSKSNHPIFLSRTFSANIHLILFILLLLFLANPPCPPPHPRALILLILFFLKSHLRLPGMSHCSTVPSGAAPVILKGRVHLSKQWIKNRPKEKKKEKKRQRHGWKGTKKKKKTHLTSGFQQGTLLFFFLKGQRSNMATTCHSCLSPRFSEPCIHRPPTQQTTGPHLAIFQWEENLFAPPQWHYNKKPPLRLRKENVCRASQSLPSVPMLCIALQCSCFEVAPNLIRSHCLIKMYHWRLPLNVHLGVFKVSNLT